LVQAGGATATLESAKRRGTATSGAYALGRLVAESGVAEAGIARLGADQTTVAVVRDGRVTGTRVFAVGSEALIARRASVDADVWARGGARCGGLLVSRTVIDLDARASILDASERLAAAPADAPVVFVVPAGAPFARNAVFLEVARTLAGQRRVSLVSSDPRARSIAA